MLIFQLQDLKNYWGDENIQFDAEGHGHSKEKKPTRDDSIDLQRREKVKEAMLHAWTSYEKYAWGLDELQVCYDFPTILSLFF